MSIGTMSIVTIEDIGLAWSGLFHKWWSICFTAQRAILFVELDRG